MKKIIFVSMISLLACSERSGFFEDSSRPYHKILWSQTQQKRYHTLENVPYETSITYKSEAFRRAYVIEYSEMYRLTPEKTAAMLAEELAEASEFDVFVISHFSTHREAIKITANTKVWRLVLTTDPKSDTGAEPVAVSSLPSGNDPVLTHFYPYISPWASNYLVKFKKQSSSQDLYLRLTGVLADILFRWKTS